MRQLRTKVLYTARIAVQYAKLPPRSPRTASPQWRILVSPASATAISTGRDNIPTTDVYDTSDIPHITEAVVSNFLSDTKQAQL